MKKIRSGKKKKLSKKLLPFFAPLLLSPVAPSLHSTASGVNTKELKTRISTLKVLEFNQAAHTLYQQLGLQKQGLSFEVFDKALTGYYNMKREGALSDKSIITIVDFTKSSTQKRLWVVDVEAQEVLHHTLVAHGRNSGEEFAEFFSNDNKSFMSSIGFYVTQNTYSGKHGLSLKLEGMDKEFNTNAKDRCIVMHGAEYASENSIKQLGRLGRSLGCPALPMEEHKEVIQSVKGGTAMYIHAAHDDYTSQYLDHATALAELVREKNEKLSIQGGMASL